MNARTELLFAIHNAADQLTVQEEEMIADHLLSLGYRRDTTERDALIHVAALSLAAQYSADRHGPRNKNWDIEKPDGPDNEYYLPGPSLEECLHDTPHIVFQDTDGYNSLRSADYLEIAAVLADAGCLRLPEES